MRAHGGVVYSGGLGVRLYSQGNILGRWVGVGKADRSGYVRELLSLHPCTRALGLREQLQSLREELEEVAQKGRARRAQSTELNSDLCKAHRWVSLCNLRGIPGSLWATASPL